MSANVRLVAICLALVATLAAGDAARGAAAPDGGTYAIVRHTLDGGGTRSSSASYALTGTIGQPDAQAPMTGGAYRLAGGFWVPPAAPTSDLLLSNGFE